jgi:hypothetical protein
MPVRLCAPQQSPLTYPTPQGLPLHLPPRPRCPPNRYLAPPFPDPSPTPPLPSPHPLKILNPRLTHNPHRQYRLPPPPHPHPRPRPLPPSSPRLHLRHRRRPRKRVLRPLRRSPLALPRKHLLPELRDQGPGGPVADLWDPVRERVFGKDKAGDGGEGGGEGKWRSSWDGCWGSMGKGAGGDQDGGEGRSVRRMG